MMARSAFSSIRKRYQPDLPFDLAGQRRTGQTGANAGSNLGNRDRLLKGANGTIGQFDIGHGGSLGKKKVRG
jgi:hypothetical protein